MRPLLVITVLVVGCGGSDGDRPKFDAGPIPDARPIVIPDAGDAGPDSGSPPGMCGEPPPAYVVCPEGCENFDCSSPCTMYCGLDCVVCVYQTEPYPGWRWEMSTIECSCPDAGM